MSAHTSHRAPLWPVAQYLELSSPPVQTPSNRQAIGDVDVASARQKPGFSGRLRKVTPGSKPVQATTGAKRTWSHKRVSRPQNEVAGGATPKLDVHPPAIEQLVVVLGQGAHSSPRRLPAGVPSLTFH
jgi:hypothetical protein